MIFDTGQEELKPVGQVAHAIPLSKLTNTRRLVGDLVTHAPMLPLWRAEHVW